MTMTMTMTRRLLNLSIFLLKSLSPRLQSLLLSPGRLNRKQITGLEGFSCSGRGTRWQLEIAARNRPEAPFILHSFSLSFCVTVRLSHERCNRQAARDSQLELEVEPLGFHSKSVLQNSPPLHWFLLKWIWPCPTPQALSVWNASSITPSIYWKELKTWKLSLVFNPDPSQLLFSLTKNPSQIFLWKE